MDGSNANTNRNQSDKDQSDTSPDLSRRIFLAASALGAGAASIASSADAAATDDGIPSIQIPVDITESLAADPKPASFETKGRRPGMSGAAVFAKACEAEGLAALFCCPGNYSVINSLAAEGIPCFGGRTEGMMCSAADGFIRVTGEIAAASGTEGPGFTNMIMNIAAANAARTPLLVVASNKLISQEDTERGIQVAYQQPTTEGIKKYGKRLITPDRVWEYAAYAFRKLKTGVPGPVHLDFPSEVSNASYTDPGSLKFYHDKSKYRAHTKPHPSSKDIDEAVKMITKAERPMIVASIGVFYDKAWDALREAAEKNDIAVVESGPSRGHFADDHPLSANTAPGSYGSVDLVVFVGQYCMPNFGEYRFGPDCRAIRVHPEADDIGRNWPIDLGIVSGEKAFLEALTAALPKRRRKAWIDEVAAERDALEKLNIEYHQKGLQHSKDTGLCHPAIMGKDLSDFLYRGSIPKEQTTIVSGGYGIAKWMRRYIRAYRPGQICNGPYQYGAIGPDIGYTVGVGAAVQMGIGPQAPYKGAPVVCITGDAGLGYSIMEMETLAKYRIPAIVIAYNNDAWGVWQSGRGRSAHMYLFQENLRYDKIAEALGGRGEYVRNADDFMPALKRSYEIAKSDGISTLINCQGKKEFWTNKYPPGMTRSVEPGCMSYNH